MSIEEATDIYKRLSKVDLEDMSATDGIAYLSLMVQMAEKMKPFADKYAPKKEKKELPKSQSGVFKYIDGELRRLD